MASLSGQCLCGAVKFQAEDVDTHFHACHCGMCRRWNGGPYMVARVANVEFSGTENLRRYRSSEWAERGFCSECGTHLFYFLVPAGRYFIAVGTFEDAARFTLGAEIFIDHKPSNYALAGEQPKLTEAEVLAQWS